MSSTKRIKCEDDLLRVLNSEGILYQRIEHDPVYTCAQADDVRGEMAAVSTKNLFLCEREKRYFLVVTDCKKRLDLKALSKHLGSSSRLVFGSEGALMDKLGLLPGSVTILALLNDPTGEIQLVIDEDIWDGESFLCHPLINTVTLVISKTGLQQFLSLTGHIPLFVRIPEG